MYLKHITGVRFTDQIKIRMEVNCIKIYLFVVLNISMTYSFTYVVTTPKIFRTDTINRLVVTATNVKTPQTIHLNISCGHYHHPEIVTMYKDGFKKVGFYIFSDELSPEDVFVNLDIKHGTKQKSGRIPIVKSSGYIFIQTDKPIYTPRDTVKYRILAVNEDQGPATRRVRVDVISPNGIILDRMTYPGHDAFNKKEFHLPKEAELGIWNITATFENDVNHTTALFKVDEYVLPTFSVTIEPGQKTINTTLNYFNILVRARLSYDKAVKGKCHLRLGLLNGNHVKLIGKIYKEQLRKGKANFKIKLQQEFKSQSWLPGHSTPLYIEVNVTQQFTEIKQSTVDMSTIITDSLYDIDLSSSSKHFKPGMSYILEIYIKDALAKPISSIELDIKSTINGIEKTSTIQSDVNGYAYHLLSTTPIEATAISFRISLNSDIKTMKEFTVESSYGTAISLAYNLRYPVDTPTEIGIQYMHVERRNMFVLVLSRGQIVFVESFLSDITGFTSIKISKYYQSLLVNLARIIVYYHGPEHLHAESMTVYLSSRCPEELTLSTIRGKSILNAGPKTKTTIKVRGGPRMRVGLVAVDQAVYFLSKDTSITRLSLFNQLSTHDTGVEVVHSLNAGDIFKDNGLLTFDNYFAFTTMRHIPNRVVTRPTPVNSYETIPTSKLRKYFPESWLFQDLILDENGKHNERIQLPDSITTWVVHAVGISATRGICVASPIEFKAYQSFHARLHLPYKAIRLEQVEAQLNIYNYKSSDVKVSLNITGDLGLCFPKWNVTCSTKQPVKKYGVKSCKFKVISMRTGDLTIRVVVRDNTFGKNTILDVIEKTLFVAPEGLRLMKTITFALDPEGNHLSSKTPRKFIFKHDTPTINNTINGCAKTQKTEIDLALPSEIIPGTESCGIHAYGDLMGDIINSALFGTGNVFVSSFYDAEEVIGNLAPTVHAMEYLNSSNVLIGDTSERGKRFITQGVIRLMKYRSKSGSYRLSEEGQPSTWFTALVLKTLCHTQQITFVDNKLINQGFLWLLDQVDEDGRPWDGEYRIPESTEEYHVKLAAEVLIAQKECDVSQEIDHQNLQIQLMMFLEDHIENIENTLVLSKVAYALQLSESPMVYVVTDKLIKSAITVSGLTYWSEHRSEQGIPYWYRQGADAFSIETTAYALLVYLRNKNLDPHPLAEWLVRQRNRNGGFVTPTDTAVAIQALAEFSALKHSTKTDLQLEISSDPSINYNHIFAFNTENAIQQKQVTDVPIGERLNVKTNGTGLGQMQIQVAYNVPTAPNDNCMYNVTVKRKNTVPPPKKYHDETNLCRYCRYGCDKEKMDRYKRAPRRRQKRRRGNGRNKRTKSSVSRKSLCLQISLKYRGLSKSGPTNVEIEMLSGYKPIQEDLDLLTTLSGGRVRHYRNEKGHLTVYIDEVPNNETVFLHLRIKEDEIIKYLQPVSVVVFQPSKPEEICIQNYNVGDYSKTLPVYCIGEAQRYKGECVCILGSCGKCPSKYESELNDYYLKEKFVCADVVYNVSVKKTEKTSSSKDMLAVIHQIHKKGGHTVLNGDTIFFTTSLRCSCPNFDAGKFVVMIGKNPTRFLDRSNKQIYRYIVDASTMFLNVSNSGSRGTVRRTNFNRAIGTYEGVCGKH